MQLLSPTITLSQGPEGPQKLVGLQQSLPLRLQLVTVQSRRPRLDRIIRVKEPKRMRGETNSVSIAESGVT